MDIKDIVLYAILALFVLWMLFKFDILGNKRGAKKSSKQREKEKNTQGKRKRAIWFMKQFESVYRFIGHTSPETEFEMKYRVERCGLRVKALERPLKVSELIGMFRIIQFFVILITIVAVTMSLQLVWVLLLVGLLIPKMILFILQLNIMAEDDELEENFPDLYLLLYSRLIKGSLVRIEPTVIDYISSLDEMYGKGVGHSAIRKFCSRFVANVAIYGDELMAIKHMREYYRSPTMVNFCNLAIQSLSGVDNKDKLLTFKQELAENRRVKMEKTAQKLVEKGNKVILIIYVILFEFIILSWMSKIDLSMISSFFGG